MALSFTIENSAALAKRSDRRRVLVTGAAGRIGSYFAQHAHEKYALRLMLHHDKRRKKMQQFGEVVVGELNDLEKLKELCVGIDTVLHLAATPNPNATWETVLESNIVGAYNVFVAAKAAECRRVIFASSIHAVSGYPADVQVKTSDPVNPGDLYGVSKCFGEALGRYVAEKEGVSVIALRIGAFQTLESAKKREGLALLDAFVSERDLQQLIERCIDDERLQFAIFNGLSDNRFKRLDITDARELVGYEPQDDLTKLNVRLQPLELSKRVRAHSIEDKEQKSGLRAEL